MKDEIDEFSFEENEFEDEGKKVNKKTTNSISYAKKIIRESRKSDPLKINRIHMSLEAEIGLMQYEDYLKENKILLSKVEVEIEDDKNEPSIKKGIEQVTSLFDGFKDCVYFTGFTLQEFELILTYCTHICEFDKESGWIVATDTKDIEFIHKKISIEYALFIYLVHIKRFPSDIELFFLVGLDRIYDKNKNPSQKMSTILSKIINSDFVTRGIESMIYTLRDANLDDIPTLDEGYHPIFKFVVENLENSHYIVDGRHQPVTKKLDENNKYKKDYYSYKHKHFGFKYNIYVDSNVKCVNISPILPAVIHDTHLHNMTLSDKLVPNGKYVIGDSGYTGAKKCIHVFRQPKKTPGTKQFTYIGTSKNVKMEINIYDEKENKIVLKKVEGTCFIRGTFIDNVKDELMLKGLKYEPNGNYSIFCGKINGYTTLSVDNLPRDSTFEIDGNGVVLWFFERSDIYLLSFEGEGQIWKNETEENPVKIKLVIEENGILGKNSRKLMLIMMDVIELMIMLLLKVNVNFNVVKKNMKQLMKTMV